MPGKKIFIVLSHKHNLKKNSKTNWETSEQVEFVDQLRNRHMRMSTAIADFTNKKVISGARYGLSEYTTFIEYIRKKYPKELAELESMYGSSSPVSVEEETPVFSDSFGNVRAKTVFDL